MQYITTDVPLSNTSLRPGQVLDGRWADVVVPTVDDQVRAVMVDFKSALSNHLSMVTSQFTSARSLLTRLVLHTTNADRICFSFLFARAGV